MFDPDLLVRSQITRERAALARRDTEARRIRMEDVYTEARYLRYVLGRQRSLRQGYVPPGVPSCLSRTAHPGIRVGSSEAS